MMKHLGQLLLVGILVAACNDSATELPTGGEAESEANLVDVTVGFGEQVAVPGTSLRIGLVDVAEDGRCPARDVEGNPIVCVWQGNANLVLALSAPGLEPVVDVLESGFDPEVAFGSFRIRFAGLAPERIAGAEIEPAAYVATLRVVVP
jgi:hypothetical protein